MIRRASLRRISSSSPSAKYLEVGRSEDQYMDGGLDVGGHCRALVFIGARWCALSVEVLLCLYLCVVFVLMVFVGMIVWSIQMGS